MATRSRRRRDIEKDYPTRQFAVINIEHERMGDEEEVEFQLKWSASER